MTKIISQTFNDKPLANKNAADEKAPLIEQARIAIDSGDFARADALLAESMLALDDEFARCLKVKCEYLELRAGVASLAGDYQSTIALYNQAADLWQAIDLETSLHYTKKAEDALATRRRHFPGSSPKNPEI